MEQSELLFTNPDSLLRLSDEEQREWIAKMAGLSVLDARTEATETFEAIWKRR